jgi:hypothetical protein
MNAEYMMLKASRGIFQDIVMCDTTNGFRIGWLDLLPPLQLQPITAHNQWLSKTRSIPYRSTSAFSSPVTDLVLIYKSVSSTATALNDCL